MSKNILIFCLIVIVVYLYSKVNRLDKKINVTKEGMASVSTIKKLINNIYNADVQAIRNLSEISKKLQRGSLTIPGNLTVKGSLFVKRGADIKGTTATNKVNLRGCQLYRGGGNSLVIRNRHGYADIGPKNRYWSYFVTDRPNFYFNKAGHFNGNSQKYRGPKYATTSDTTNLNNKINTLAKNVTRSLNGSLKRLSNVDRKILKVLNVHVRRLYKYIRSRR